MDLDDARRRVMEAPDVPAISDVLLEALEVIGRIDVALADATHRLRILEGELEEMRRNLRAGLRP